MIAVCLRDRQRANSTEDRHCEQVRAGKAPRHMPSILEEIRLAKVISGRTLRMLPRLTDTVPVFTPRGFLTSRARAEWTAIVPALRALL